MSTIEIPLFINPAAGRGRAGKRLAGIRELLVAAGITPTIVESRDVRDLENEVRRHASAGVDRIIVVGGDGSIHEAVNGLLGAAANTAFGVIPSGTGNDFAKAAGIPVDWETATTLLADRIVSDATPRAIDAARMNERFFANGAGIGFDAKVTRLARAYRWPIGDFVYLFAIFRAMADGIATPNLSIRSGAFEFNGPVTLANVSNGAWIGGMFHIAPIARNDDGKLELLIVDPVSRRRIMSLLPRLIQGKHMNEREISHLSVKRVSIVSDEPTPSHLDGEVQPLMCEFDIEVLPGALRLL
ncbi:MAG: diacylglycerol kinase family lipid kinase [Gammaproteobacteria bacterium]|nr:diacylglycerol kinase family lipid kinase [Gammaproteobacteria bacterium]NNC76967.1 diacylglycerol kinase family lipid kinase [Woeseiaceae bacterium]